MSRVWVLGNAGVDLTITVPRLPYPGETLVGGALARAPGGKGLNQAVVAARAGAAVHFLAPVGDDAEGGFVRDVLAGERLAALDLVVLAQPTDLSVIMVDAQGENSIVTAGGCADALDAGVAADFAARAQAGDVVLLQGNLSLAASEAAIRTALRQGARVMLNTAPLRWDAMKLLAGCAVVVANAGEAAALTGLHDPQAAVLALQRAGAMAAVVTLRGGGCIRADATGNHHCAARPAVAVDTTGAGDAFCGVLAAALAMGAELAAAIDGAQRAAAIAVSRAGAFAALPSADELAALGICPS